MDPQEIIDLVTQVKREIEDRLEWLQSEVTRRVNEIKKDVPVSG